jgi:hypothetical protein
MEFVDLGAEVESATLRYVAVRISRSNVRSDLGEIIDFLRSLVQELTPVNWSLCGVQLAVPERVNRT